METQLTRNFTLKELIHSDTADANFICNIPSHYVIIKLTDLAENILQPLRDNFNQPVIITSGYRNEELNILVRGTPTSQHTTGQAADLHIKNTDLLVVGEWIEDNLNFDQLILESYNPIKNTGWIHVSYKEGYNRNQVLNQVKGVYNEGLT